MNKIDIKEAALNVISALEAYTVQERSYPTCMGMWIYLPELATDYEFFILDNEIIRNMLHSIRVRSFDKSQEVEANLFRMMVVTEFFRELGIEL
jgi:hypothetical protein